MVTERMVSMADYYELLGVPRSASAAEIKQAYRKQALQFHPDRNPGDAKAEAQFKAITAAYEVLSDPQKRQDYDRYGETGVRGQPQYTDLSDALRAFMRDFGFGGDPFGDMFGGGFQTRSARGRQQQGQNLQLRLRLSLHEVAEGTSKTLRVRHKIHCQTCNGSGSRTGTRQTCRECGGRGQVQRVAQSFLGRVMTVTDCPGCAGEGEIVGDPCAACGGEGLEIKEETLTVKVPAGVATGNIIQLRGQGDAGPRRGPNGDLFVLIEEEEDPVFQRVGDDIVTDVYVSFPQAALGDRVEVPTLDGKAMLRIPPGSQSHRVLRMRGKGIGRLHGTGRGDELVRIIVHVPENPTREEKRLIEELRNVKQSPVPPPHKGRYTVEEEG